MQPYADFAAAHNILKLAYIESATDLSSYTDKSVGIFVIPVCINRSFIENNDTRISSIAKWPVCLPF